MVTLTSATSPWLIKELKIRDLNSQQNSAVMSIAQARISKECNNAQPLVELEQYLGKFDITKTTFASVCCWKNCTGRV